MISDLRNNRKRRFSERIVVLEARARLRRLRRSVGHIEARLRFALQRKKRLAPLTAEQIQQYHRDGHLLVSGLIPEPLVVMAEAAMWQSLGANPLAPETWVILGPHPHLIRDVRMAATYTDAMLAAAAQLAGEDVAKFRQPTHVYTINNVPVSRVWRPHQPHLDRALEGWRLRTFPRPYWVGAITYLTSVQQHGGGTIVWPGSHLKLAALARTEPKRYKYFSALSKELSLLDFGPPIELTPARGDVWFHHYLCVHASSDNVSGKPRLAIDVKW